MSDKPEVVAKITNKYGDPEGFAERELKAVADIQNERIGTELIRLSDHEAVVAPLLKRARTAERESMSHMKTLRGLERVSMAVADHSDEVNVENNLLRQERASDKARIEDLENLLKVH